MNPSEDSVQRALCVRIPLGDDGAFVGVAPWQGLDFGGKLREASLFCLFPGNGYMA